jgi:NitT/TauT family transport system permease protein
MKSQLASPRRLSRTGRWVRGAIGVAVVFAAAEAFTRAGLVNRSYLPPASSVVGRAFQLLGNGSFLSQVGFTVKSWVTGELIAIAIAVPLGLLLGSVPVVATATRAIVEFLRPVPTVALIPLVSLLLGSGMRTEVIMVVYASIWSILFNTIYGLQDADPVAKETLRTFGFGPGSVLVRVSLPSAAPFIATGIRISASVGLIVAVSTEILSGFGDGLGIFIAQAQNAPDGAKDVLASTVWAGMLGLLVNSLLLRAESRLFRWHTSQREGM